MSNEAESAHREMVRAWYAWRHTELPVGDVRQNRSGSPAFVVELALDHLRSYVYALGSDFLEDRPLDYPARVADHLERLHEAEVAVEAAEIDEDRRQPYREFAASTRRLLYALLRCASARPSA